MRRIYKIIKNNIDIDYRIENCLSPYGRVNNKSDRQLT